jgi:hypothetical protein
MPTKPDRVATPTASPAVREFLAAAGRKGGLAKSPQKAKMSAANGTRGGRPRKKDAR